MWNHECVIFTKAPTTRLLTCYYVWDSKAKENKIDANLCTHVMLISGLGIGSDGILIYPTLDLAKIKQFVAATKSVNPQLKILYTLGPDTKNITAVVGDIF